MTWGAVGGAAIGAAGSYFASQAGAGAAGAANAQNIQFQTQYNQQHDPFSTSGARAQYVPQLNQLMQGGYAGLANDPMYQQLQALGMQGTQRAMAAQGQGLGTNDILAINQNQTGTAMSYFDQQYQRLAQLSGASGGSSVVPQGMSPTTAGGIAMAPYQALGQGIGTLAGIYGNKTSGGSGDTGGMAPGATTNYNNTLGGANTGMENPVGV